ncbi:hypothetical protein ig2599ANME_0511 [groundwater metagenome]
MRILMLNYEYPSLGGGGSNACEQMAYWNCKYG